MLRHKWFGKPPIISSTAEGKMIREDLVFQVHDRTSGNQCPRTFPYIYDIVDDEKSFLL